MKIIDPKAVSVAEFHANMLGVVAPRPIALASTVDKEGNVNLSPYSFFNAFSANPPVMIFSPARRVRDNTTKHTLENIMDTREVVINIVNHNIVEQMSLASTEYDRGVNEFTKSGLTAEASDMVSPPRVAESPASFECKVREVISLGEEGGAGNLIICEVLRMHINEDILDENGKVDPFRLDAVGRMGGNWYCRANDEALFEIPKPLRTRGIGVDNIPESIRFSDVLTGNNLGRLGNVEKLPETEEVVAFRRDEEVNRLFEVYGNDQKALERHLHELAKNYLDAGETDKAWKTLLQLK